MKNTREFEIMSSAKQIKDLLGIKILSIFMVDLCEVQFLSLFLDIFDGIVWVIPAQNVLIHFES